MQARTGLSVAMTEVRIRQITPQDRDWVLDQHRIIYMDGHGFDRSFAILVAEIVDGFFARHDAEGERGWIAEDDGVPLGAVFCTKIDETTAQLRLFFLVPEARGQGVGRALMNTLLRFAEKAGYAEVHLWTHQSHEAACRLYKASGWRLVDEKPHQSFGKQEVVESYVYTL